MAGLLVSVRSADEAAMAVGAGADVIDIKEPRRGPLGRADPATWRSVRAAVPASIPVSIALGELADLRDQPPTRPDDLAGITYRKLGLAGAPASWRTDLRAIFEGDGNGPSWIAVIYADWRTADAPRPEDVLDFAVESHCRGLLVDTWDKSTATPLALSEWMAPVARARAAGLLVALAGQLDLSEIGRLRLLRPDLFAVRSAACASNDRLGAVDPLRVAELARAVHPEIPDTAVFPWK